DSETNRSGEVVPAAGGKCKRLRKLRQCAGVETAGRKKRGSGDAGTGAAGLLAGSVSIAGCASCAGSAVSGRRALGWSGGAGVQRRAVGRGETGSQRIAPDAVYGDA